jgi:hypothetical protein
MNEGPPVFHPVNDTYELPSARVPQRETLPAVMASRCVGALVAAGCAPERAKLLVAEESWLERQANGEPWLWLCECARGCRDLEKVGPDFEEMLRQLVEDVVKFNEELRADGLAPRW